MFVTPLRTESIRGTYLFRLLDPLVFLHPEHGTLRVPAGYVSNLASTPRWVWWLLPPAGPYRDAAVLHDWLYTHGYRTFSKVQADRIFYDALRALGIPEWQCQVMYAGVHYKGKGNW